MLLMIKYEIFVVVKFPKLHFLNCKYSKYDQNIHKIHLSSLQQILFSLQNQLDSMFLKNCSISFDPIPYVISFS